MRISHVILTRFSMRTSFGFGDEGFPIAWLDNRLRLLEDYAIGGIAEQTARDFLWLLLCDESTDSKCLARLERWANAIPQLRIALLNPARTWRMVMREHVGPPSDLLLTTRLDSDDALNIRYVESVHAYLDAFVSSDLGRVVVNFPRGFQYDALTGRVFERQYPDGPFPTMIERWSPKREPVTVFGGQHTDLPKQWPTHQDLSISGWLQVIHGGNIKNEIAQDAVEIDREELTGEFALRR